METTYTPESFNKGLDKDITIFRDSENDNIKTDEIKISYFQKAFDPGNPQTISLNEALNRIRTGASKDLIEKIRKEQDGSKQAELKKQLPAICFNAEFPNYRAGKHTDKYKGEIAYDPSGLMILDFDHFDAIPEQFKRYVFNFTFIYAAWLSPRNGVKALAKIPQLPAFLSNGKPVTEEDYKNFTDIYKAVSNDIPDPDESGKDIARLCFESYDPKILIKDWDKTEVFKYSIKEPPPPDEPKINTTQYEGETWERARIRLRDAAEKGNKHTELYNVAKWLVNHNQEPDKVREFLRIEISQYDLKSKTQAFKTIEEGIKAALKQNENPKKSILIRNIPTKPESNFIRVGDDYYKNTNLVNMLGEWDKELRRTTRQTILDDFGRRFLEEIPKYDAFCCVPDHLNYKAIHENCFNQYSPFRHKPIRGEFPWTMTLLKHVFGDQYEFGLDYLQLLYLKPTQILPILCLVSFENGTGKTTFLNWLFQIFQSNMIILGNSDLESGFNGFYANKLVIAVDESKIDKQKVLEKIKSLATARTISVNQKFIAPYTLDFFGKIILCSNYEDSFINAKDEDIRYWIKKLRKPTNQNFNIDEDLKNEIPYFLHFLQNREMYIKQKESRMWFHPESICTNELTAVREHSRSWLYKEIWELFTDYFNNYGAMFSEIEATPGDIKNRFFQMNSKVEINYIRRVLKQEYKLFPEENKKYRPFGEGEYKSGTPYVFSQKLFLTGQKLFDQKTNTQSIDNENDLPY